jgi:rhomboid family GlyGly-CTERM serine protease
VAARFLLKASPSLPRRPWAWSLLAAALALGSAATALLQAASPAWAGRLDWQSDLAWSQPWRWWSAAFVHLGPAHLAANLAGCAGVAAFGLAAGLDRRATLAWLAAWPLTHLALLVAPGLVRHAGLSGVLHAGVAVAALFVALAPAPGRRRWVGAAVAAGLGLKIVLEAPWAAAARVLPGWDFPVVVLAHATGALSGAACALVALAARGRGGYGAPRAPAG